MLIRPALREYRTWTTDSRRWELYNPRSDDIIIATSPKCGTTWMQQIVCSMVLRDPTPRSLMEISPWIDGRSFGSAEEIHQRLEAQTHRRFVKSHLPVDGLPFYDELYYIHVARDGRDVFLSMHNQYMSFTRERRQRLNRVGTEDPVVGKPFPQIPKDPTEYFRLWLSRSGVDGQTDGLPAPSFFDLEIGYWQERKRENVLMVHYNDLLADLDAEMRRIATFLGIEINEAKWPSLVHAASFKEMQAAGRTLMPVMPDQFFNKGTNGRWRDILAADELARYEAKVRAKFTPGLAAWIQSGRLVAGDPRKIAD